MHEPNLEPHLSDIIAGWRQIRREGGRFALPDIAFLHSLAALTLCIFVVLASLFVFAGAPLVKSQPAGFFVGGAALLCLSLACGLKVCKNLLRGYSFRVSGETITRSVRLTSWQVVKVGDLRGLGGKALLIKLQGKTLFPHIRLPRSLVLRPYRPEREVRYHVRVCGCDETGECELINQLAFNGDGVVATSPNGQASDACTLLLPIYQQFPRYELEIRVEDADGLAPREETCIKQLFLRINVAVPAKQIGHAHEVSIRNAQVAIVDEA